jgi:hypothetical protein
MRSFIFSILTSGLLFFVGCAAPAPQQGDVTSDDEFASIEGMLIDGTPEGVGVLDFLNDPSTSLEMLDIDAKLNKKSAKNILHHRDGWDGVAGTNDDNLFNSIAELDAVPWVGNGAITRIIDFAWSWGWIPEGDDVLGSWDKVAFTVNEAIATIDLANTATHTELDKDFGLDRRAADSIAAAQPGIVSVSELSKLYYVGKGALKALKAHACLEEMEEEAPATFQSESSTGYEQQ